MAKGKGEGSLSPGAINNQDVINNCCGSIISMYSHSSQSGSNYLLLCIKQVTAPLQQQKTYTILPSSHWLLQTGLLIFFNFLSSEYLRLTWRIVFAKRATEGWKCSDSWKETCEIRSTPTKTAGYLRKSPKLKLKRIHQKSDSQNLVSGTLCILKNQGPQELLWFKWDTSTDTYFIRNYNRKKSEHLQFI